MDLPASNTPPLPTSLHPKNFLHVRFAHCKDQRGL